MKVMTVTAAVCVAIAGLSLATAANAAVTHFDLHIPREPLDAALRDLAHQTGVEVGHFSDQAESGLLVGPVQGSLSAADALGMLLHSTGLSYRALSDRAYIVATPAALASARESVQGGAGGVGNGAGATSPSSNASSVPAGKEGKNGSSERFRLAQVDQRTPAGTSAVGGFGGSKGSQPQLQEIIVTAQKRVQRLQDVPVPVTAISAESLLENNQPRLQDYFSDVPGLSFSTGGSGDVELAIRGLTTGENSNPSVGITIDDVPYGASTLISNVAIYLPDLDPSDLSRVEVLRGPQGTLYGASSIGGLLKFVTADPSTTALSGRMQADGDWLGQSGGTGYGFRGAVNIPLSSTLALRVSGFTHRDPGYVENVQTGQRGVNRLDTSGGHLAALWSPSDALRIKLGAVLQNQNAAGAANVDPSLGDQKQSMLPGTGTYNVRVRLYTANINAHVSGLDIASVTGYGVNAVSTLADDTPNFGGVGGVADGAFGVTGATGGDKSISTRKFSQEVRLSSQFGHSLDWMLGGFYTHEASGSDQFINAADAATGAYAGLLGNFYFPSSFAELAGFADLTVHVTHRFDVQFGGRESSNRQVYNETDTGPFIQEIFNVSPLIYPTMRSSSNAFTYLVTPRYRFSDDLMLYARFASGFRPGGPNADAVLFGFPAQVGPDKSKNYEVGLKVDTLDHRLSFDASLYYIDWQNLQIGLTDEASGFVFLANAGSAKSDGVELAVNARPLQGLVLSGWVSFDNATLTSSFPPTASAIGVSGDRLPYSSKFSANLSAREEFPLTGELSGFVGGQASYVGDRYGDFLASYFVGTRPELPGYARFDLNAGVREDTWTVSLFANNLSDRRGVISINPLVPNSTIYIQPRTIGLSLVKTF